MMRSFKGFVGESNKSIGTYAICARGGRTGTKITFWSMITSILSKRLHESKDSVVASIFRTVGVATQRVRVILVS